MSQGYYATIGRRIRAEFWVFGVAQVIVVVLAIATLALQIKYGLLHASDFRSSVVAIVLPYIGLLVAFLFYQSYRVPRMMYQEQAERLSNANAELTQLRKTGLRLQSFRIIDMQREVIGDYPRYASDTRQYHIFIRVEIQMGSPPQVDVTRYRLELNFHGLDYSPAERYDTEDWEMTIAQHHTGAVQLDIVPLKALPTALKSGLPHEGWLHFETNAMTDNQLFSSRPRLYIETHDGFSYAEISERSPLWNNNKHFKKKNATSAAGSTSPVSSC